MKTQKENKKKTPHFVTRLRKEYQERVNPTEPETPFTLVHMIAYPKGKTPHNFLVAAKNTNRAFEMVQSRGNWVLDDDLIVRVRVLSEKCGPQEFIHEIKSVENRVSLV